jgi:hypothetical protein
LQGKVDVTNPQAVRQNLHDILKAPVSQPIGNTRELKPSTNLGLKQDNKRKETPEKDKEKQNKEKEKGDKGKKGEEPKVPPKRRSDEGEEEEEKRKKPENKKMVFSDRKDYIQHQIKVLKERVDNKDKNISAHRYVINGDRRKGGKDEEEKTKDRNGEGEAGRVVGLI